MREWVKGNIATIVLGLLGCAGLIGSFVAGLLSVIAVSPWVFVAWSLTVAVLFCAAGWLARAAFVKKELGMPMTEASKQLASLRTQRDEDEAAILSMSDGAQLICLTAWNGHLRGNEVRTPLEHLKEIRTPESVQEAEQSGLVILARCGAGRVRIEATKRLIALLEERPDVHKKLIETMMMCDPSNIHEYQWTDVTFLDDDRHFTVLSPEEQKASEALEQWAASMPFWQRLLLQSLLSGDDVIMLSEQYERFTESVDEYAKRLISSVEIGPQAHQLSISVRFLPAAKALSEHMGEIDPEPYVEPAKEALRPELRYLVNPGEVSWYVVDAKQSE